MLARVRRNLPLCGRKLSRQAGMSLKERADMLSPFFTSQLRLILQNIFNFLYELILFRYKLKVVLLNFSFIFFIFFFSLAPLRMFSLVSLATKLHSNVAFLHPELFGSF